MSERRQMRRRLRERLRVREALLLDLGALVYELHRQGKRAPELLQEKAAELTVVDEEVRELQATLDGRERTTEGEAVAGEEPAEAGALEGEPEDEGALDAEPGEGGEREEEGELGEGELGEDEAAREDEPREDELRDNGEAGREGELRQEHELDEEDELGDTGELDALDDEQLEGGGPEEGGPEYEDSYDAPLVEREEPRP